MCIKDVEVSAADMHFDSSLRKREAPDAIIEEVRKSEASPLVLEVLFTRQPQT